MSGTEKPAGLALLRQPFAANQISQMCRSTKKDNPKGKCGKCGGWHGLPAVQLSYVGHAALTDRLLEADPKWSWEPLGFGPDGLPALDRNGGMWIKLTVCEVTRLGYGDAQNRTGGDGVKEMIGDALRNAAMRFGAALDLWHKGDLHVDEGGNERIEDKIHASGVTPNSGAGEGLTAAQKEKIDRLYSDVIDFFAAEDAKGAYDAIEAAEIDNEEKLFLWSKLGSKERNALKKIAKAAREANLSKHESEQA